MSLFSSMTRLCCFLILLLLVFTASVELSTNSMWTDCCKSTDSVRIHYFDISPYPLIRGSDCHITLVADIDENIEGGNVTLSLSYGYNIIVIKKKFDLCELVSNSSAAHCPLRPDLAMLDIKSHIPTTLPQGRYRGRVIASDSMGHQLMCIGLNVFLDV